MTPGSLIDIVGVWLAALLTISVFSFLFKDNPFYKLAEHVVVGVSAGYTTVILFTTSLKDLLLTPLWNDLTGAAPPPGGIGDLLMVPAAKIFTSEGPFSSPDRLFSLWLHVVPGVLGILILLRLHPKVGWISRYPLSLFLGVSAGIAIPTFLQTFVVQPLRATFLPVLPGSWTAWLAGTPPGSLLVGAGEALGFVSAPAPPITWWQALCNLVIVAGTLCGIVYFFFSKAHKGVTGGLANVGIWTLMVGFGSTFGFTVMSRVSLLVGRFEFLINRWLIDSLWRLIFPAAPPSA